jgi:hypothetical protein
MECFPFPPFLEETEKTLSGLGLEDGLEERRVGGVVEPYKWKLDIEALEQPVRLGSFSLGHVCFMAFFPRKIKRRQGVLSYPPS